MKIIIGLIFLLGVGVLYQLSGSQLNRDKLDDGSSKVEAIPVKEDKLRFISQPIEKSIIKKSSRIKRRDKSLGLCKDKWKAIVDHDLEYLLDEVKSENFFHSAACIKQENSDGLLVGYEKCLATNENGFTVECIDFWEAYRSRVVDRMVPDELGFDNMSHDIVVNKFLLTFEKLVATEDDKHVLKKAVLMMNRIIELNHDEPIYYFMKLKTMALTAYWDRFAFERNEWEQSIFGYEDVGGDLSVSSLARMFMFEVFGDLDSALIEATDVSSKIPDKCFGYYHLARIHWHKGDKATSAEYIQKCISLADVDPLGDLVLQSSDDGSAYEYYDFYDKNADLFVLLPPWLEIDQ